MDEMTQEEMAEMRRIGGKKSFMGVTVAGILKFRCINSFEEGENVWVEYLSYEEDMWWLGVYRIPILCYVKSKGKGKDIVEYVRDKYGPRFYAKNIGRASGGKHGSLLYLFPSRKLGKGVDVVVKIPVFAFEENKSKGIERFAGAWTNEGVYFGTIWKNIPTNVRPPELRNLLRIFDCADIYGESQGALAGYPDRFPKTIATNGSGVNVTVSEQYDIESLDAMDREQVRSILMENGNIYGLFRALYALQDPGRLSGATSHLLIHCGLRPGSLFVKNDEETGKTIVKIGNWISTVRVPVDMAKGENAFILKPRDLDGDPAIETEEMTYEEEVAYETYKPEILGGIKFFGESLPYICAYMAPELFSYEGEMDARKTDLFSLCLVLFEMFTMNERWYNAPEIKDSNGGKKFPKAHFINSLIEGGGEKWDSFIGTNLERAGVPKVIANIIKICCKLNFKKRPTPEDVLIVMENAGLCPEEMKGAAITEKVRQEVNMPKITAVPKGNVKKPEKKPVAKPAVPSKKPNIDENQLAVNNMADATDAFPGSNITPELLPK
ncbi:MAG: hypothetical protein LBU15_01275 [Rickettsiales bacterium]|jgi:hypothetical protein|nr:hypothetical protein [Rickettsiales bacterium]